MAQKLSDDGIPFHRIMRVIGIVTHTGKTDEHFFNGESDAVNLVVGIRAFVVFIHVFCGGIPGK
jgi:hypothetical protein